MKTTVRFFVLMLIVGLTNPTYSQSLKLTTDKDKTCSVDIVVGQIKDNIFDLNLKATWVSPVDGKPIIDNQSILGFDREKISVTLPGYIKLISPVDKKVIAFNSSIKLSFEISEKFQGGDFVFKFPFFYATSVEAANDVKSREEFTLKRPRDFSYSLSFKQSDIVDKYAPLLSFLSPEGVNDGSKPILDTNAVRVEVLSTDAFGIDNIMINNTLASRVNDSTFAANINLKVGYTNKIVATATDKSGKVTKKDFEVECRQPVQKQVVAAVVAPPVVPAGTKIEPSDVDIDIPTTTTSDPYKFALIIGNEDYTSFQASLKTEMNVEFAIRDAEMFKEYAMKVMGVPADNIIFIKNAKALEMHRAISQVGAIMKNSAGNADVYVYYAGHGFPDETTKEAFLVPVDVSGSDLQFAIKLSDFYKKLSEFPAKKVTVFLDACFSGGGRDLGLMAARGVKVKPKEAKVVGNLIVFTASSGDQSSLPYREKNHGLFTYFLLKKLKETSGDVTYQELSNYLISNISIRSVMVNNKEQNPQTNISPLLGDKWKEWRMK